MKPSIEQILPPWEEDLHLNNAANHSNVINVGWPERMISAVGGVLLVSSGLSHLGHTPVKSFLKTLLGGWLLYRGASGNCALYTSLGKTKNVTHTPAINVRTELTVQRSRYDVYDFWRKLENLPLFMRHLASVREIDDNHSHWEAIMPANLGRTRWTAEIVKEEYGSFIGWQSIAGASIENAGKVEFRDAPDGGTELRIVITYRAPAGDLGAGIARLLNPIFQKVVERDVHQFKNYIEGHPATGLMTTDGWD